MIYLYSINKKKNKTNKYAFAKVKYDSNKIDRDSYYYNIKIHNERHVRTHSTTDLITTLNDVRVKLDRK